MRQIKFRAWFIHEKEYRSWEDILSHRYNERWFIDNTDKEYINCIFTDDTIILEQYTGLKDKNGTEIYDGDIVECDTTSKVYKIIWNDDRCCFEYCWQWSKNQHSWNLDCDKALLFKVIGNINENQELM